MAEYGTDISGWQPGSPDFAGDQFVIVKATQGIGVLNPNYHAQIAKARSLNCQIGHYHYQDVFNPIQEARFFLANIDLRPGEILGQDIEGGILSTNDPVGSAVAFCDEIIRHGHIPASYLNDDELHRFNWAPLAARNTMLWKASYNNTGPGSSGPWPFVGIWQNSDKNVSGGDSDVFNGDANAWAKIGNAGGGTHPAPAPAPAPAPHPVTHPAGNPVTFTAVVAAGDTFSGIAQQFGVSLAALEAVNPGINYNRIYPGQVIHVPGHAPASHPQPRIYLVRSGDNLSVIAARLGTTVDHLVQANGITDPNKIYPNETIKY